MRCCEQLRARSDHGKQAAPSKYSKDDATYRKQLGWFRAAMEAMFPAPPRTLDNRKDAAAAERAPPPVMVFVHPRKCAGKMLTALFKHNAANVFVDIDYWRVDPTNARTTNAVLTTNQEFDSFDLKPACDRCYVTIGRSPVERVVSLYRWRIKRKHIPPTMSLRAYLTKRDATGVHRDDQYHGFYSWAQQWCGKAHRCTRFATDRQWILDTAKANVERYVGLIGTVERFDAFVKAGTKLFPAYFGIGDAVSTNRATTTPPTALAVARAHYPASVLALETEFYEWAKARAERLYSRHWGAPPLPRGSWTPQPEFWQTGGAVPPWIANGGYRPASFDSANHPRKAPALWACTPDSTNVRAPWYAEYARRVDAVLSPEESFNVSSVRRTQRTAFGCARWWHPRPQYSYKDYPPRVWTGALRPTNFAPPPCAFGRASRTEHKCAASHRQLVAALDALRVVYFPRSGTELGIVRESRLLSSDGDLDIHVDMPSTMLHDKLKSLLTPPPHLAGSGVTAEVHWSVPGCPEAHLVYNDWISHELQRRATPSDLCACRMNSVDMLCHRDGLQRMYTQYGPSWKVPLGIKQMDMPGWASDHRSHGWVESMRAKLNGMVNQTTGWIEADAVEALMPPPDNFEPVLDKDAFRRLVRISSAVFDKRWDTTLPWSTVDPLILAQLNVLYRSISK